MKDCLSESKRWDNGNVEVRRIDEAVAAIATGTSCSDKQHRVR
jgi:hypothetical protein